MERLERTLCYPASSRISDLLRLVQDIAAKDAERRSCGQTQLLAQGCTWVLVKNRIRVERAPMAGQTLVLRTWPTSARFGLYPRAIELCTPEGDILVSARSQWVVMNTESRTMVTLESLGLEIRETEEQRFSPMRNVRLPQGGESFPLTVTPAQIDENGHMNNASYFDAVEPYLPPAFRGRMPVEAAIDYERELLPGVTAALRCVQEGDCCYFEGSVGGKTSFRLSERFAVQSGADQPVAAVTEL